MIVALLANMVAAAQRASPAVVSITVVSNRRVSTLLEDPFWRWLLPPSTRTERVVSAGSGFLVDGGLVVTNAHVVGDGGQITVTLSDGRSFRGELVWKSDRLDLAVLRVETERELPSLELGDSDSLLPGQPVLAIGNPIAYMLEDYEPTVTQGIISGLHRTIAREPGAPVYRDMVQTDAAINPGNSGGPLVDEEGRAVGVNTFIVSKSGGFEGIGFAIPINTVKKVLEEIRNHGRVREAYLPVGVSDQGGGVVVVRVKKGLGLRPGDRVVEAMGRPVRSLGDWEDLTYFLVPGDTLWVVVERGGKRLKIPLVAQEPEPTQAVMALGAKLSPVNDYLREKFKIQGDERGLVVLEVERGSLAEAMGLRPGDLILEINGVRTLGPGSLKRALSASRHKISMVIKRGRGVMYLSYGVW